MKEPLTTKTIKGRKKALDCCHRCGGLMVSELSRDTGTVEWHCVLCGERVDPVILAHRRHNEGRQEAEQLFAGSDKAGLN